MSGEEKDPNEAPFKPGAMARLLGRDIELPKLDGKAYKLRGEAYKAYVAQLEEKYKAEKAEKPKGPSKQEIEKKKVAEEASTYAKTESSKYKAYLENTTKWGPSQIAKEVDRVYKFLHRYHMVSRRTVDDPEVDDVYNIMVTWLTAMALDEGDPEIASSGERFLRWKGVFKHGKESEERSEGGGEEEEEEGEEEDEGSQQG